MVRGWHILDRPAQDRVIRTALSGEEGGGVVVVGAAGVGKTTLARAVTATLPAATVHWVACTDSSRNIPLGAFAQWVGDSAADNPAGQIAAARRALLADGNVVVGVDDAHLLDPLSATLLHNIAIDRSARIVATVRNTEQVPEILMSLWKDGYLQWLEVQPLTRQETTTLLESVLGGTVEELSADFIWESSEGNPAVPAASGRRGTGSGHVARSRRCVAAPRARSGIGRPGRPPGHPSRRCRRARAQCAQAAGAV